MIPTIANIRKAIYCLNKRIDQLEGGDYQDTMVELSNKISALESLLDDDAQNPTAAIDKFNEIVAFLDSINNTETLQELLRDVIQQSYQQNYVTVPTYASLPATGSADTIYRVSNYNGSTNQIDTTSYSEYVWDNSDYTLLCVKSQMSEVFDISAYHATGGTLATYSDLSAALDSNNGGGVPQSFQKGGMRIQFVRTSDNKYVQYRLMADEWSTTVSDWQGVIDSPISESDDLVKSKGIFEAIKKSERGFVVDYNHLWNFYAIDDNRNRYSKFDTFDCIWISIPKGAKKVHVDGIPDSGKFYYYFSSYEISNGAQVYFRNYQEVKVSVTSKANGADYIPYFVGESTPILLLIDVRKSDLPEGFSYDNVHVWFDYVEDTVNCESSLNGKKISILGDSMSGFSTYTYWMDGSTKKFNNRYPANASFSVNNVMSIHQMWWKRLFDKCGAVLEVGSCIGSSGISDNRYYNMPSYLDRYASLGNPDVIFIEGFHNEPPYTSCTFNPSIPIEELDTLDVGQAYDKLIRLLKTTYPSARIIDFVIAPQGTIRSDISKEIDSYYKVEHIECLRSDIDFTTITTDIVHPDSDGMERIADYVIERLANNATHVATEEFVAENTLEEKKYSYSEEGVVGYVTDKNRAILAKINKDGSIDRLVDNYKDKHTVHFEDIDIDGIISVLSDKNKNVIATINNKAEVDFYGGGGFAGEKVVEAKTWGYNKLVVSKNNIVVGGIKPDGTVKIFKAEIDNLNHEDVDVTALIKSLPIISSGLDNISISNDKRVMNLLTSVNTEHIIEVQGNDIKSKLKPCISIVDDDAIDYQIPSSVNGTVPLSNRSGYFSSLFPLLLSLGAKYGIDIPANVSAEGHRVGFTPIRSNSDEYSELNENGRCLKWLHNNKKWCVLNHSMTAQLPMKTYFVDGINSELAQQIKNNNNEYYAPYDFQNCIVLDRLTGKWYELNNQSESTWVERTPTKKYALPFYREYINADTPSANHDGSLYFNRDFDFNYSWGEWFRRADELGLPNEKFIVFNGATESVFMVNESRKYANYCKGGVGWRNYPPLKADISAGYLAYGSTTNVKDNRENEIKSEIDKCFEGNQWLVFTNHAYDGSNLNYYVDGVTYPDGDPNYPSEWIVPLKYDEIQDIIGDNVHDYINQPPSRLNISTWDEWHPAPGTKLSSSYSVLDYALSKGIDIISIKDGLKMFGNILNIGVDKNGKTYQYDSASKQTPFTEEEQSFLTIGADGSIRYFSK